MRPLDSSIDPVGHAGDLPVVGDDEHGAAGLGLILQQLEDLHAGAEVEVARGLVGDEQRVAGGEGPGDGHPLLLAAGQLARVVVQPLGQPHLVEHLGGPLAGLLGRAGDLGAALHVLERGEGGEQVEGLEDERHHLAPEGEQVAPGSCR